MMVLLYCTNEVSCIGSSLSVLHAKSKTNLKQFETQFLLQTKVFSLKIKSRNMTWLLANIWVQNQFYATIKQWPGNHSKFVQISRQQVVIAVSGAITLSQSQCSQSNQGFFRTRKKVLSLEVLIGIFVNIYNNATIFVLKLLRSNLLSIIYSYS